MCAMLFCTINNFPVYGNLSGYKVKGHKVCPICEKDTCYHQLEKGKKTVYLKHRKFLNRYYPYRRLRKAFNGEQEHGVAPKPLTGEEVYQRQQGITAVFGKYQKWPIVNNIWKKRSVFFGLPYWSNLEVRHCIDVMHVEKNVCDSVIGTLLNIQGKTKDGINARLDLGVIGNKTYLPPACHTLSKKEKTSFWVPKSRHDGRCEGVGTQGLKIKSLSIDVVVQAHLYILNNTDEVQPYLSAHKSIIKKKYPKMSERGLLKEHNKSFSEWFKEKIAGDDSASKTIKRLSYEPKCNIITWSGNYINKNSFYTKAKDDRSTTQNSGVMIVAESMHFSSAKDKNPVMASMPYFGVIEEIWEVDYVVFKVPVFKCKLVDINSGVRIDEFGVTLVDLSKLAYADEPFITTSQAKQVFYITDPSNKRWSVVVQGKVHDSDENQDANLDISETPPFSTNVPTFIEENVEDDVHAICIDHEEGIWEN
ncbi:uncharacterized protein LOC131594886 [Vicia villosa]|uniref:uncharacterized protein LOC131594886 n=1 Tax=Vicia villosa TaxID=3911 RepID=UPI00273BC815|nr:uncharacterized protein LOC131594886 [Vicia villosa]